MAAPGPLHLPGEDLSARRGHAFPFQRVLVGYDGSPASRHALRWALSLVRAPSVRVTVLAVAEPGLPLPPGLGREVDAETRRQPRVGTPVTLLREQGRAAEQVLRAARLGSADLVAIGSHGHHPFSRSEPRTVVDALLRRGATGVLVAKASPPAGRILCASDGSPPAVHALEVALALADVWRVPLDVLHVTEAPGKATSMPLNAPHEEVAPRAHGDVPVTSLLAAGEPAEAIVETARRQRAGLIVLGSRGPSRPGGRGIARRLVLEAPCSVLVARRPLA